MDYTLDPNRGVRVQKRYERRGTPVRRKEGGKEKKRLRYYIKRLRQIQAVTGAVIGCTCLYIAGIVQTTDIYGQSLSERAQPLCTAAVIMLICAVINLVMRQAEKRAKK